VRVKSAGKDEERSGAARPRTPVIVSTKTAVREMDRSIEGKLCSNMNEPGPTTQRSWSSLLPTSFMRCARPLIRLALFLLPLIIVPLVAFGRGPALRGPTAPPMEVVLLGTGYPRPDPARGGPAAAVVAGDRWFVIDAGRGVTMRIAATPLRYSGLQAVFLTHLHSDHTAGLPDLFDTSWQFGRFKPLQLYGPLGTQRLSDAMLSFFADDIHYRRDLLERHPAAGATIRTHVVHEGVVYDDGTVRVTAFAVDHRPVEPAFGYRFDSAGKTIVLSGDTRPTPNLVKYARGADVLVLEAYLPEWFAKVDKPEVAARLEHYHTSAEEAGQIAAQAGVKTLVLTHLIPGNADATFLARASKSFKGRIIVGRDLLQVRP
jgi:ribonuclease Z